MTGLRGREGQSGDAVPVATLSKMLFGGDLARAEEGFDRLHYAFLEANAGDAAAESERAQLALTIVTGLRKAKEEALGLLLLADLIGVDHVRRWLDHEGSASLAAACFTTRDLERWLTSPKAGVRAAATVVAAMVNLSGVEALVGEMAGRDSDTIVRASALLALSTAGDSAFARGVVEAARADTDAFVAMVAALALLRLDPTRTFETERDALAAWLSWEAPPWSAGVTEFPWFGGAWVSTYRRPRAHDHASRVVAGLAREGTTELGIFLLGLARGREAGTLTRRVGALVADLGGLQHRWKHDVVQPVVPFDQLSSLERATAKLLAATDLLPGPTRGMPAAGSPRRRWCGIEAPGPMEQVLEASAATLGHGGPRYVVATDIEREQVRPPLSVPLGDLDDGFERWLAATLWVSAAYGNPPLRTLPNDLLRSLVDGSKSCGVSALERAAATCSDLAERFRRAALEGEISRVSAPLTALALLPFVEAKMAIEPAWDVLVTVSLDAAARQVFASLPPERREAILWSFLSTQSDAQVAGTKEALEALELAASPRNSDKVLLRLQQPAVVKFYGPQLAEMRATAERFSRSM